MAQQTVIGIPSYLQDDGVMFRFTIGAAQGAVTVGFMHRPIDTPAPTAGGTVTPPVTWTEFHNLESWVETVKHGARNNANIEVVYDDAIVYYYNTWHATYSEGSSPGQEEYVFLQTYNVNG
jgi:hypothetical protein